MNKKDESVKIITRKDRERIMKADRLVSVLYGDLESYRDREGLEEIEMINLSQESRKALLDAGAQFVNYDVPGPIGPGLWGGKTTMCVPPEWVLEDEGDIKKTFDVFDFARATEQVDDRGDTKYIIKPILVFKKGVGYPPVCIYKLANAKMNTQYVLVAQLFDYVAAITKQTL